MPIYLDKVKSSLWSLGLNIEKTHVLKNPRQVRRPGEDLVLGRLKISERKPPNEGRRLKPSPHRGRIEV
jgi:hypothetical protein